MEVDCGPIPYDVDVLWMYVSCFCQGIAAISATTVCHRRRHRQLKNAPRILRTIHTASGKPAILQALHSAMSHARLVIHAAVAVPGVLVLVTIDEEV